MTKDNKTRRVVGAACGGTIYLLLLNQFGPENLLAKKILPLLAPTITIFLSYVSRFFRTLFPFINDYAVDNVRDYFESKKKDNELRKIERHVARIKETTNDEIVLRQAESVLYQAHMALMSLSIEKINEIKK